MSGGMICKVLGPFLLHRNTWLLDGDAVVEHKMRILE